MSGANPSGPVHNFGAGPQLIDGAQLNQFFAAFSTGGGHTMTGPGGIAAAAGGGMANATPLPAALNLVTTVATTGDSVGLPAAVGGQVLFVANGATNDLAVWVSASVAPPGDMINGGRNVQFTIPAGKAAMFFTARAGGWRTVLSA